MATRRPTTIISLAEEADARGLVEHRAFERALVLGPAVIAPLERVSFINGSFGGDPDTMFIEVPEGRLVQGVVGLRDVTFKDCRFENIAIIGTSESIAMFRAEIQPDPSAVSPPPQPLQTIQPLEASQPPEPDQGQS